MLRIMALVVALGVAGVASAQTGYTWKMAVVKMENGKEVSLPFTRPLKMVDGDQFFLVVVPEAQGNLLILYEDTTGEVTEMYRGLVKSGQLVVLPGESDASGKPQAFAVSPPGGTEKLHVVISAKPQTALERLLPSLPGNSRKVLDAVTELKTSLSSLGEAPEKPAPMGGTHRGLADASMTQFTGKDTYVRTIRFDH
jgi:hypothetical protein